MSGAWRFRNSRQLGLGSRLSRARIYFATVLAETLNPNLANSAWIRFSAPERIFRRHAPNESLKFSRDRRATAPRPARRSPRPVTPPTQSLPSLEPSQALQSATSYAIRQTIDLPESRSADPRCSDEVADDGAARPTIADADKSFPQPIALWAWKLPQSQYALRLIDTRVKYPMSTVKTVRPGCPNSSTARR
jgi:hypothetical protein